jgi:hypothetical protein
VAEFTGSEELAVAMWGVAKLGTTRAQLADALKSAGE